jgi:hypothetical protein
MDETQVLRQCVKALGVRHVVTLIADLSQAEAQLQLQRGDRVRAYAASQAARVLRHVLRELPTNSTVGASPVRAPGRLAEANHPATLRSGATALRRRKGCPAQTPGRS